METFDLLDVAPEPDDEDRELMAMFHNRVCRLDDMVLVADAASIEELLTREPDAVRIHLVRKQDIARRRKALQAMVAAGWALAACGSAFGLWVAATRGSIGWAAWLAAFEVCMVPYILKIPAEVCRR